MKLTLIGALGLSHFLVEANGRHFFLIPKHGQEGHVFKLTPLHGDPEDPFAFHGYRRVTPTPIRTDADLAAAAQAAEQVVHG